MLSLADKPKIIEQSDKGVTGKQLAEMYGVGQAISDIKRSTPTLLNFVSVLENGDAKINEDSNKQRLRRCRFQVVFAVTL